MNTAMEAFGHIEILATAVALNLEGAPVSVQEEAGADPIAGAMLGGINMKNLLSAGLSAMPVDTDDVPFDMSYIYASNRTNVKRSAGLHGPADLTRSQGVTLSRSRRAT